MWKRPIAERLVGRLRDAAALAGDERVGDGAGLAGQGLETRRPMAWRNRATAAVTRRPSGGSTALATGSGAAVA